MKQKVLRVLTVLNTDGGDEAIYVDGQLKMQDRTLYLVDIVAAADGKTCRLFRLQVSLPEDMKGWPATEVELMQFASHPEEVMDQAAE